MGGGKTTTTIPPPSPQETALQAEQLKLARMQSTMLQREQALANPAEALMQLNAPRQVNPAYTQQQAALAAYNAGGGYTPVFSPSSGTDRGGGYPMGLTRGSAPAVTAPQFLDNPLAELDTPAFRAELAQRQAEITSQRELQAEATKRIQAALRGESLLSPEQKALIGQTYESSRALGEEDIRRFGDETAGLRGLRLSDTPVGGEMLRAQGRLALGLRSAQAGSELQFGLNQQLFNESLRQFQEGLRQQAFSNRLALVGAQPANMLSGLQLGLQTRMAQPTVTHIPSFSETLQGIGQVAQGVGGLAFGLGGFGSGGGRRAFVPGVTDYFG